MTERDYRCDENCDCVDTCRVCDLKKQVVDDFVDAVLSNEMTLKECIEDVFELGVDVGFKESLLLDIEMKEQLLLESCAEFEEE